MIGRNIAHYHIVEKLGEGGMGVVYKAQDTKLKRDVALKFLPAGLSSHEPERARFLQEAQAAAALNHPNICTIHDIAQEGNEQFIVMEYVDGVTLREKIAAGSLHLPGGQAGMADCIVFAIQIAEALREAHGKGIVHRDVKAENIMVNKQNQVKVMDFGLAKLKGSLKLTRTSSTAGTLAYMPPEQIQGGEIDVRSDVFSFGVLLYEMLTGHLPFRGEHEAALVYSIVNEEPQALEQYRRDVPPLLSGLIFKCLEKDPADRYQHMDDIVSELRRTQKKTSRVKLSSVYVSAGPQATSPAGATPEGEPPSADPSRKGRKNILLRYVAFGASVIVLAIVGWFLFAPSGPSVNPEMTTRVLQIPFTQYSYPSLSPDGKWIAFPAADVNGKWDIYYMHVSGGEPRKITSDATRFIQQSANISPDGSQIVYDRPGANDTSDDLFAISALGGTSRKLASGGTTAQWRPDGERIGFIRTTNRRARSSSNYVEFWTVRPDGSDLRREFADSLFVTTGMFYRFNFCWAPDGKSIAWIRSLSRSSQVLLVHELEFGKERVLTDGPENIDAMAWTRDNRIIFSSNRGGNTNLWVIPASGGKAVQVTKGGGPDIALSVSASGNELAYLQQQSVGYLWTVNIDGSSLRQISFDEREIWDASFSPDRKRIAFVMRDPDPLTEKSDVYIIDRDGNNRRRLTTGNPTVRFPVWSPDGRKIAYVVPSTGQGADTGRAKTYVVDVDNPGAPKLAGTRYCLLWLDDDHIVTWGSTGSYIATVSSGTTRQFFTDSLWIAALMDRRFLVYYDLRRSSPGWWKVEIEPTTADELLRQRGDVVMPTLRGSARKLSSRPSPYYISTTRVTDSGDMYQFAEEDRLRLISCVRGTEKMLPTRFPGLTNRGGVDVSPDGKEVLFVTPRLSSRLILLERVFR